MLSDEQIEQLAKGLEKLPIENPKIPEKEGREKIYYWVKLEYNAKKKEYSTEKPKIKLPNYSQDVLPKSPISLAYFDSRNFNVEKVSRATLGGYNILGRTWLGTQRIQIANDLAPGGEHEVITHELKHHELGSGATEEAVRQATRTELYRQGHVPIYH